MKRADDRESFELKALLNSLGNALESQIPESRMASFRELVSVGEGKVALENLCSNIADYEIQLQPSTAQELVSACERLEIAPSYWEHLAQSS